jgi:hypothetical protein
MAEFMELTHFVFEDELLLSAATVLTGALLGFSFRLLRATSKKGQPQ